MRFSIQKPFYPVYNMDSAYIIFECTVIVDVPQ